MKKIWKENSKLIIAIVVTIVLASGATYAATTMYDSNTVSYDNTISGLRSTNVQSALDELYGNVAEVILNMKSKLDELYQIKDIASGESTAGLHNAIFRGKDVTSYYSDGSLWKRINGTDGYELFEDLYVGDYIKVDGVHANVNGRIWRIAGFDIYYMSGYPTSLTSHHLVIVPDEILGSSYINSTATTSGGYMGSYVYTTTLPSVKTNYLDKVFSGHILTYNAALSNDVVLNLYNRFGNQSGATSSWTWAQGRYLDLMNEVQVTGATEWSSSGYDIGSDNIQFPLFRLRPEFKIAYSNTTHSTSAMAIYWLRAVASSTNATLIDNCGISGTGVANESHGIRPYFYIG